MPRVHPTQNILQDGPDNGSCNRSRLFGTVLEQAGITHKRTRPYRPQTNGKIARLNLKLE